MKQDGADAMEGRGNPSLPDGYWARQIDGAWYLFDRRNVMLAGPLGVEAVEARAWHEAWRRIDREIEEELSEFRAGTRGLHELRRTRQYLRMLDAVAAANTEPREQLMWRQPDYRRVLAAAAAVFVIVVAGIAVGFAGLGGLGLLRQPAQRTAQVARPAIQELTAHQSTAAPPPAPKPLAPQPAAPAPPAEADRWAAGYAVSVGTFGDAASAEGMMHRVRRKGYVVYVVPTDHVYHVLTPPFPTRRQAGNVKTGLEAIQLPANLVALRLP
jgi:cell division septation protein DedD